MQHWTLWEARDVIAEALADTSIIFIYRWSSGWLTKVAKVALSLKSSKEQPGNYRPQMSEVRKLLDGVLSHRIYQHLDNHGLIRDCQHGFVCVEKKPLTNWIVFFEEVTKRIQESRDVVYMDFGKTFDKVPNGRLVCKGRSHEIQAELTNKFKIGLE